MKLNTKTARLLDANLNRAREGLRVVEDTARFLWDDKKLYQSLRSLRHKLHSITQVRYKDLLSARESETDVGRRIPEGLRPSVSSLVSANLRRAQEAVRVLEEYSKIFSNTAAADLKRIRYQLYMKEKMILKKLI